MEIQAELLAEISVNLKRQEQKKRAELHTKAALKKGKYDWPKLDCPAAQYGYQQGNYQIWSEGLMSYVGYKVGARGEPRWIRWKLIDCVVHKTLPNVNSASYMQEWGEPKSRERLAKLHNFLSFYSEHQGPGDWRKARSDYNEDLNYFQDRYVFDLLNP